MNILICDDIPDEALELERMLNNSELDVETAVFYSGAEALEYYFSGTPIDCCFLDIAMPIMSGVVLAEKLRENGFDGQIIFLTRSNEYATESYAVNAFFYMLKPPAADTLNKLLKQLESAHKAHDSKGVVINIKSAARFISFRDISFIEAIRHHVHFRLIGGEELEIYAQFGEIASQLLTDSRFAQSHRSFIVNIDDISFLSRREITMRSGALIPISRTHSVIKDKHLQRIFGGGPSDGQRKP